MTAGAVIGWDIGGSNTKVARVEGGRVIESRAHPFELRLSPGALTDLLRQAAATTGHGASLHAITMTAELSRTFVTKREGVAFVLAAAEAALGSAPIHVFSVDGAFVSPADARRHPLRVAAANWMAAASIAARVHPDAVFVDVGTTTSDVIPISGGAVAALGKTDPERLASGELIYAGAVRTPVEALAADAQVGATRYALAAEAFATSGDVHLWRGDLTDDDYACETADGRPATRDCAGDRLARAICADRELMDDAALCGLADALARAQAERLASAIRRVASRHRSIRVAVVAGIGAFMAARAARAAGLDVRTLAAEHGDGASRCAPAAAVALLLDERLAGSRREAPPAALDERAPSGVEAVVKIGGGLLAHPERLREVLTVVAGGRVLVVPGGGPFADAVRDVDRIATVGDDAAHWMAVLAMDQYAELLAARLACGMRVTSLREAERALASRRVPVLAPSRWLREADPLPHSWDVTSDSIAAWVAGQVGARRLLLVKPPGATGVLTDAYFARALPTGVTCEIVTADDLARLRRALEAE